MRSFVKLLISAGKVKQSPMATVRLKLLTACSWQCWFCHQEGNPDATGMKADGELERVLIQCKDELGVTEAHLSGGEPTLHKDIESFVRVIKRCSLKAKLTSNGQSDLQIYDRVIEAGVEEVNLSIHSLDPRQLGLIMLPARSSEWGENALRNQLRLIRHLRSKYPAMTLKVNTVVTRDNTQALKLMELAAEWGLKLRLMNDLNAGEESYRALRDFVEKVRAVPEHLKLVSGSSSYSVSFRADSMRFAVKLIRLNILPSLCAGCERLARGECNEYFYGLRLENHGGLQFRLCLHRQDAPAVLRPDVFFLSPQAEELKRETSAAAP